MTRNQHLSKTLYISVMKLTFMCQSVLKCMYLNLEVWNVWPNRLQWCIDDKHYIMGIAWSNIPIEGGRPRRACPSGCPLQQVTLCHRASLATLATACASPSGPVNVHEEQIKYWANKLLLPHKIACIVMQSVCDANNSRHRVYKINRLRFVLGHFKDLKLHSVNLEEITVSFLCPDFWLAVNQLQ